MKEHLRSLLVTFMAFFLASFFHGSLSYPVQEPQTGNIEQPISDNIQDLSYLPQLPQSNLDPRMRLYLLSWLQNVGALRNDRAKAKRTCRLNAGLSHSCDYKDTLAALHEGMYLGSDMTPGKK